MSIQRGKSTKRGHTSDFVGVSKHESGDWMARIGTKYLGLFNSEVSAALAYDIAAIGMYGSDAKLNLPMHPSLRRYKGHNPQSQSTPLKTKSSSHKGVYWNKRAQKWHVQITLNGKQQYLGIFEDETDAAKAYDAAAKEHAQVPEPCTNPQTA